LCIAFTDINGYTFHCLFFSEKALSALGIVGRAFGSTTDSAKNMEASTRLLIESDEARAWIPCAAHRMQTCIKKSFQEAQLAGTILLRVENMNSLFRTSNGNKHLQKARAKLGQAPLKAIEYNATRWSSRFTTGVRVMLLKKAILYIVDTFTKPEATPDQKKFFKENKGRFLTAEDFANLEKILSVVKPSVHFSDVMSANTPAITLLYPMLYDMTKVHLAEPVAEAPARVDENEANNGSDLEGEGDVSMESEHLEELGIDDLEGRGDAAGSDHEALNDVEGLVLADGVGDLVEDQEPVAAELEVQEIQDDDAAGQFRKVFLRNLMKYFPLDKISDEILIATFLNPANLSHAMFTEELRDKASKLIVLAAESMLTFSNSPVTLYKSNYPTDNLDRGGMKLKSISKLRPRTQ
jgi:hypothetical protein